MPEHPLYIIPLFYKKLKCFFITYRYNAKKIFSEVHMVYAYGAMKVNLTSLSPAVTTARAKEGNPFP